MPRLPLLLLMTASLWFIPAVAFSRAFEVRLLKGTEKDGVWGTDEYQVSLNSLGGLRDVAVQGKKLLFLAALYTSPVPLGAEQGLRTVQGEGVGQRGLTVQPPEMKSREDRGRRVFQFEHLVANTKVLEGRPLCRVDQEIVLTPSGEISVRYDCQWLETIRWDGFSVLVFFEKDAIEGRDFLLAIDDRVVTGRLAVSRPIAESRIREPFTRLTVWSEAGPFHVVWDSPAVCELTPPQLSIQPAAVGYRAVTYQGTKGTIQYRILLPVSQQ
ncbi:MAG: hypothetical protein HUU20_20020 [Pirellulales bacterium]|nr:hypothetical protein [Pirellulales bacterium]